MTKSIQLNFTDEQYDFFYRFAKQNNLSMSDVLKKIILDGFVISVGEEEYLELDKKINEINKTIKEYGIYVVENYSEKDRDAQMKEILGILKEIKNIREELYIYFEKSQKEISDIETSLLNEYSLRENIELLRNRIKEISDKYLDRLGDELENI
ncbi:MAG: hypothetical protein E7G36_00105 [Peptoniphilus rhinitidis]|uniref:hypothetical protein n=1 Tax=Peptoniphilus rhinitidis TaxID=1175452 RepID=UPI0029039315|nr:hypothetical protein [Peptoniphilus rhinitidis]MDU2109043.1 hypothetical protein [Peptoniphilus lacydonensis]MDU3750105.1 hypothetical protein [Peptoniphilus rhinitidis]